MSEEDNRPAWMQNEPDEIGENYRIYADGSLDEGNSDSQQLAHEANARIEELSGSDPDPEPPSIPVQARSALHRGKPAGWSDEKLAETFGKLDEKTQEKLAGCQGFWVDSKRVCAILTEAGFPAEPPPVKTWGETFAGIFRPILPSNSASADAPGPDTSTAAEAKPDESTLAELDKLKTQTPEISLDLARAALATVGAADSSSASDRLRGDFVDMGPGEGGVTAGRAAMAGGMDAGQVVVEDLAHRGLNAAVKRATGYDVPRPGDETSDRMWEHYRKGKELYDQVTEEREEGWRRTREQLLRDGGGPLGEPSYDPKRPHHVPTTTKESDELEAEMFRQMKKAEEDNAAETSQE